jgi:alpha-ketoglutarate-dependent sulfate ester dioxygenase
MSVRIEQLSPAIGAEVHGLDLSCPLSDDEVMEVQMGLHRHHVLFFRNQHLDYQRHVDFARQFGVPTHAHPLYPPTLDAFPQIHRPAVRELPPPVRWGAWHADATCMQRPPRASILRMVEQPDLGGDTLWASMEFAYERLSEPLRRTVDGLVAVHDGNRAFGKDLARYGPGWWDGKPFNSFEPVVHPVVRIDPDTGRRGLFVNPLHTSHIEGLSRLESDGVLRLLYAHITMPEHTIRFRWNSGDVAFWDNRSTLHQAITDFGSEFRDVHRVMLEGDVPFGPARSVSAEMPAESSKRKR